MLPIKKEYTSFLFSVLLLLIAMTSLHLGGALAKNLFPYIEAEGLLALRQSIGSIILLIIFKPWKKKFKNKNFFSLIIYGLALGSMNYFFYLSLKTVPLGIAVSLEFSGPLVVTIISSRRIIDFFWLLLAIIGLMILLISKENFNSVNFFGTIYALIAGVFWGTYIIFGKKAGSEYGPCSVAIASLVAAIVFCPIGFLQNKNYLHFFDVMPTAFFVAILSTALPYSLEIIALSKISIKTFGILMSLEPVIAAISGMLFLKENLSLLQWLALIFVIIASTGATITNKPK